MSVLEQGPHFHGQDVEKPIKENEDNHYNKNNTDKYL